ncbi:PilZ domain-containing protein [bacterium]|nr:PilZ domain-containing protein [bacterium]
MTDDKSRNPLEPIPLRGIPLRPKQDQQLPPQQAPHVPPPPATPPPPQESHEPTHKSSGEHRVAARRPCSFPGLLRILMPEQSFIPKVFAVRIVDLSPSGARIETLQMTQDQFLQIDLEPRFVRLEVLVPSRDKIVVSGKLVWTNFAPDLATMGIAIHPRREDLAVDLLPKWDASHAYDSKFLTPPHLDGFPATTGRSPFRFTGRAFDADRVIVEGETETYETKVTDGRFSIDVPLVPSRANNLNFIAMAGKVASDSTPAWIMHKPGHHDTQTFRQGGLFDEILVTNNGRSLKLKFTGAPAEMLQALRQLADIMGHAEKCIFQYELRGDAEEAAECLRKGAKFPWNPE